MLAFYQDYPSMSQDREDDKETGALLREYLLSQRPAEKKQAAHEQRIRESQQVGVNQVLSAFQTFTQELQTRLDMFEKRTDQKLERLEKSPKVLTHSHWG